MMDACWSTILASYRVALAANPEASLSMFLLAVPVFALPLAVVLAPAMQRIYSRRVQRFMGLREVEAPPIAWWQRRERQLARPQGGSQDAALREAMRQRERRIVRATLAAYLVFVLYALLVAPFYDDMAALDIALMVAFAAMLGAGPAIVNIMPHGSKWLALAGAGAVTAMAIWAEGDVGLDDALIGMTLVVLLYITSVHRTMRALVVPLLVLSGSALVGAGLAMASLVPMNCVTPGAGATSAIPVGDWAIIGATLCVAVLAFTVCLWMGTRLLVGLARVVQRGWLSDVSLVAATGLALLAGILVLAADDPNANSGVKAALFAGWLGLTASAYGWTLRSQPAPRAGRRLLMLRVFSRDRRTERLLDAIQSRWRLAGPVLQIAGPDLVRLNLDLHEFIHLVSFRLHEMFQPAAVPRETLAASLDLAPDREGRFRVNEVFCFDSSWRTVLDHLLDMADAVLLDLRGFGETRKGTAHEVRRLAALGLMPKVVALGDRDTDWSFFGRCVAEAAAVVNSPPEVDTASPEALQQCLDRLLDIADSRPVPPSP